MSDINFQDKDWLRLREQYLKQIEEVLTESSQPNVESIVEDVRGHLDRRFAELSPMQRTWENYQAIITEMGPPSEYAELAGQKRDIPAKKILWGFVVIVAVVLLLLIIGTIVIPLILSKKPDLNLMDKTKTESAPLKLVDEQKVASAIEAAKAWLQLVDEGKYDESWSQAAGFLKKFVSEEQLKTSLEAARKPLGKVLSRKVQNSTYTTTLPGAPDGQYVVIQFETSFENKQNAVETITPMLEPDGQWRVSGYYIR
ncbi:MAG: DUF4019 domain-containing protein [Sedimentisphaerales bacterium]